MEQIRLGSSPLVHAPGFVRYLLAAVPTQRDWAFATLKEGWNLDDAACKALLIDKDYTVEGDVVIVTVGRKTQRATLRVELTYDITDLPEGSAPRTLITERLKALVDHAEQEGLFTGDTELVVRNIRPIIQVHEEAK